MIVPVVPMGHGMYSSLNGSVFELEDGILVVVGSAEM
jgi:hypothetical protein